jgi:hypothetical protein
MLGSSAIRVALAPAEPGSGGVQGAMTCFNMSRRVEERIGDMHAALEWSTSSLRVLASEPLTFGAAAKATWVRSNPTQVSSAARSHYPT